MSVSVRYATRPVGSVDSGAPTLLGQRLRGVLTRDAGVLLAPSMSSSRTL